MSRKIILICMLIFYMCFINGCENAPDNNNENNTTSSQVSKQADKFVSLEEAKEQLNSIQGKKINDFVFPEYFDMPDIDEVCVLKLSHWDIGDNWEYMIKETLHNMWGDYDAVDWQSVKEKRFPAKDRDYVAVQKNDDSTGYLYSYDSDGFFSGDSLKNSELTVSSCMKEYDFEWKDSASKNDVYQLEDGKISVYDAVEYTEKLFNTNLAKLENSQFTYKVQRLYVMKNSESKCYDFNMVVGRVYKNINVMTSSDFYLSDPKAKAYDKIHCGAHFIVVMRHKNMLDFINICNELFGNGPVSESKEIISPLWAVQLMNEQVAHTGGMSFDRCGLLYVLVQDNNKYSTNQQDVYQSIDEATYLRPVWMFIKGKKGSGYNSMTNDNFRTSILVDATDGTLYYYEGTNSY